jgi:hypothetical protein
LAEVRGLPIDRKEDELWSQQRERHVGVVICDDRVRVRNEVLREEMRRDEERRETRDETREE